MTRHDSSLSRRALLANAGALVIAVHLPSKSLAQEAAGKPVAITPNAFIRIAPDDTVTILVKHLEMGQGPMTGLATIVAEELDADWTQMRAEHAPANLALYANLAFGVQGTGGSTAIANSYEQLRKAGAAARAMLISAAADAWAAPASKIKIVKGVVSHASGKQGRFGEFAVAAAAKPIPAVVQLKDPSKFTLIGADLPKLDTLRKTSGSAPFTIDQRSPDMLIAVVAHAPRFGGKLISFDATKALAIAGVVAVKQIPEGVAIFAKSTWPALKARDLLEIQWDEASALKQGSDAITASYVELSKSAGAVAAQRGSAEAALTGNDVIEHTFVFPYLAHAPMEPLDCVMQFDGSRAKAIFGCQFQTVDQAAVAKVLGITPENVTIETVFAGGSFGRRAQPTADLAVEAAQCVKALGTGSPVKLIRTREDDMRAGYYRPLYVHRLRASLAPDKSIGAWSHTIVGQSIMKGTAFEALIKDGIDDTSVEGAKDLPYAMANFRCDLHTTETKVPVLWWRSVGHTHTAFSTETFLDLLLEKANIDPVTGRLSLLRDQPRYAGVVREVARFAQWRGRLGSNKNAFGIAVHKSFGTYVAQIAEVTVGDDGLPKVRKVWCAVDCGVAVNPNIIRAQMEGGIGFGLGHALYSALELDKTGRVIQGNFNDYRSLLISEMPEVEVSIIPSSEAPTGVGEPGVPPIAPAVANAWRALTGQVVTRLPFSKGSFA